MDLTSAAPQFHTEANVPAMELKNRISALQNRLTRKSVDAALIVQNTDLYYFSGTTQQGHLYISPDANPILMVRKSMDRAMAESGLKNIFRLDNPSQIPSILRKNNCSVPKTLGMELDVLPVNLYRKYKDLFSSARIVDISHDIRMIRSAKSPHEIGLIRQASAYADQVADCVKESLREGATEVELAGVVEARARKLGHQGMVRMRLFGSEMFYGHLMSGANATVPSALSSPTGGAALSPAFSQGPGFKRIQRHEPVLFDYVFAYQGYLADHTRIFSVGELPDALVLAHETMLELQSMLKRSIKSGTSAGEAYEAAIEFVAASGYSDYFMGAEKQRIRFVGHGLGLELDEYPFLAKGQEIVLEDGMTIALEPKLVIPGKGVVGIENTHIITDQGLEQLTVYEERVIVV